MARDLSPEDVRSTVNKDVFDAIAYAYHEKGFSIRKQGHGYGLYCPCGGRLNFVRVDGTPRNPTWHARKIRRAVDRCPEQHDLMRT